jgi:hypothetical protein
MKRLPRKQGYPVRQKGITLSLNTGEVANGGRQYRFGTY